MREEDDLRTALHTLELHTPDPDRMLAAIRASGHPAPPPRWRWRRAAGAPRTWGPRWVAPLAAAAAVVAVVASSIVVAKVFAPGLAGRGRPPRVVTTAPPFPTWDGLPGYFAEVSSVPLTVQPRSPELPRLPITQMIRSHVVDIVATSTGRLVAMARLPGYVGAISASEGSFFAASVTGSVTTFYEIRLTEGGTRASATKLPIPPVTAPLAFIAASPDGSKLAISTEVPQGHSAYSIQNLIVAATATGAARKWITPDRVDGGMLTMNWLADGKTLAFTWVGATEVAPTSSLRLLDTAARGDDLLSSTPVVRLVNQAGSFGDYTISPDGKAVIGIVACLNGACPWAVPGSLGKGELPGSVVQFAAASAPKVRYTEPQIPGGGQSLTGVCTDPLWIGPAGRTVLLPCYQHLPATSARKAATVIHVVLLTGNRVSQLPWLTAPGYGLVAFPGMPFEGGPVAFPPKP